MTNENLVTPQESDEYDPIPPTEKVVVSPADRIANSLERIAAVLEAGPLHINIDHGHIEHIDHLDHVDNIDHGDVDVHNHSF